MRSQTIRKYEAKPIVAITFNSYASRSEVAAGSLSPQRDRAPSRVRCARYSSASPKPSGTGNGGSLMSPKPISMLQRSAMSSVLSQAAGNSAKSLRISAAGFR